MKLEQARAATEQAYRRANKAFFGELTGAPPIESYRLQDLVNMVGRSNPELFSNVQTIDPVANERFTSWEPDAHKIRLGFLTQKPGEASVWKEPANVIRGLLHESVHSRFPNGTPPFKTLDPWEHQKLLKLGPKVLGLPEYYAPEHNQQRMEVPENVIGWAMANTIFPGQPSKYYPEAYDEMAQKLSTLIDAIRVGAVPFVGDDTPFPGAWERRKTEDWKRITGKGE